MRPNTFMVTAGRKPSSKVDMQLFGRVSNKSESYIPRRYPRSSLPTKPRRTEMPKATSANCASGDAVKAVIIWEDVTEVVFKWARVSFRGRQLTLDTPLRTIFPGDLNVIKCAEEMGIELPEKGNLYETGTLGDFLNGRK